MTTPLRSVRVTGFRSISDATVRVGPLTVLVGPNGSGKSNILNVLRFLNATIRFDLATAIDTFGGFDHIIRDDGRTKRVRFEIEAAVTPHSHDGAPDKYILEITQTPSGVLRRSEEFTFKRFQGQGRRITVNGSTVTFGSVGRRGRQFELADAQTTGLSTLPKLAAHEGGEGIDQFASFLSSMVVLEPNVAAAREPSRLYGSSLADDASNLADALMQIRSTSPQAFTDLTTDMKRCLPGLQAIEFSPVGGSTRSIVAQLRERGVSRPIDLADASFGTVRMLSLLAMLYQPDPPRFLAIEEIDHGLHPYALDVLVDSLRLASQRTQILIATHSPTFVNRLDPDELVICDRNPDTGESVIPAISTARLRDAAKSSELRLGELWFAGALGGVPNDN